MKRLHGLLLLFLLAPVGLLLAAASLTPFIVDYDPLDYSQKRVQRDLAKLKEDAASSSRRKKRSVVDESFLKIDFVARKRNFRLLLTPDDSVFDRYHLFDVNGRRPSIQPSVSLFEGSVEGDSDSYVHGSVKDGVFDGTVHFGNGEIFHIEKATKYFSKPPNDFHSIVYDERAIKFDRIRRKRSPSVKNDEIRHCGLTDSLHQLMSETKGDLNDDEAEYFRALEQQYSEDNEKIFQYDYKTLALNRYRRETNMNKVRAENINGRKVHNVRTCSIYMQADHKLYDFIFKKEGQKDHQRTQEEILTQMSQHIKAVNNIYQSSNFGGINGINFVIQRTSVYNSSMCRRDGTSFDDAEYPFCPDSVDVSNYLNLNSNKNHSVFCLAYALTYRDFNGGTLGLAWVASPQANTAGGVCQVHQRYSEGGHYRHKSLNTGIITLVNYGNRVPTRVSQLTLAHEIGHNFGSPHDGPARCHPGLPLGNFIMFSSATSGDKPNNAKFSPCSVSNISNVLFEVLKQTPVNAETQLRSPSGGKRNCFALRKTAFCGNGITEEGEECDCGFSEDDCKHKGDKCCHPHVAGPGKMCRRRPTATCSPSEGACCDPTTCSFYGVAKGCREADECNEKQKCNGREAKCPPSAPKSDNSVCQEGTRVCNKGVQQTFRSLCSSRKCTVVQFCNRSICEMVGLTECFVTEGTPQQKCQLACEDKKKNGDCLSSYTTKKLSSYYRAYKKPDGTMGEQNGIMLRPGSPCDDYKGYCDIFRKCRSVDSNGPLSRLKRLLFDEKVYEGVRLWIYSHWWAVVLMLIGLVLLMALFIKCCAVHTPSTNPNKPPAHRLYDTLRHPSSIMHDSRVRNVAGGGGAGAHRRHGRGDRQRQEGAAGAAAGGGGVRSRSERRDESHRVNDRDERQRDRGGDRDRRNRRHRSAAAAADVPQPASSNNILLVEPPPAYAPSDPAAQPSAAGRPTAALSAQPNAAVVTNGAPAEGGPRRGHRKNRPKPS